MNLKVKFLVLSIILFGSIVGSYSFVQASNSSNFNNGNGQGVSVKELADLVVQQQQAIEELQAELANVKLELEEMKNKETSGDMDQFENRLASLESSVGDWRNEMETDESMTDGIRHIFDRFGEVESDVNWLKVINQIDTLSIENYINDLPHQIQRAVNDLTDFEEEECERDDPRCDEDRVKEYVVDQMFIRIGVGMYSILDYVTEEEVIQMVKEAVESYENRSHFYDKIIIKHVTVDVIVPGGHHIIEVPIEVE
ncbi:hypothetical protein [Alkalihalobacterium elongatum]|uniref:hypothetical protein n=1 Tax=Alkalihalobacterium elongatum TaxID=2675466 RepID=UPI001C20111D|nr:hypothetical protein [Alkalihalobacterium elongatum]